MKTFLGQDVLLDVLAQREPFYADAARVWTLAERSKFQGVIAIHSFTVVSYHVRRLKGCQAARTAVRALRDLFIPAALDEQITSQAMDSSIEDFEDAIQYFSALRCGAECLVTRNVAHFPSEDIRVMTPAEFLATYFPDDTAT